MGLLAKEIIERVQQQVPYCEMHGTTVEEIVILTLATLSLMAWERNSEEMEGEQ